MIKCFLCQFGFETPRELCEHIKKHHSSVKSFKCVNVTCRSVFTVMWSYQRHLNLCCKSVPSSGTSENIPAVHVDTTQNKLKGFEENMDRNALALVCKLASNMNVPRNYTYEVLRDFQDFYSEIIVKGFNEHVRPYIKNTEHQANVDYFIQICNDPFRSVNSEFKLDNVLSKADTISPLNTFEIDEKKTSDNELECSKQKGTLMPLAFQFKKFFELPQVFELTEKYAEEMRKDEHISHFINAEAWKEKLVSFEPHDTVIPFHLHIDETQINNALGSHRSVGLETCTYYSFPTIPPQYNSRLENIFAAQLFSANAFKKCGALACFSALVDALNEIASVPITLQINGKEHKVFFALGLILGDNKGVNDVCGFARSHSAIYFCRFCRLTKKEAKAATTEVKKKMRNKTNYSQDLKKKSFKQTGIKEDAFVNSVHLCHATISIGIDIMHDVFEGILHYNLCEIILALIRDGYCSLDALNTLKTDLSYGEVEAGDKSPPITMKKLQSKKILMSASEMQCFIHHSTLILGDLIPDKNYEVWQFLLQTIKFVDMLYLPFYTDKNLASLTDTIAKMNAMYIRIFNQTLKPKHHYVTHYPTMIRRFGPLYYISSMRYEAKHKVIKNYTKNTSSRVDLSYSLGKKLQYNFASRLLSGIGLLDIIKTGPSKYFRMEHSPLFQNVERSQKVLTLLNENLKETSKVIFNGIHFSEKLYLTLIKNGTMTLFKIEKILFLTEKASDIFFICKEYRNVVFNENYQCFEVNIQSPGTVLKLISVTQALKQRRSPVSLHAMDNNKIMFRTKSF